MSARSDTVVRRYMVTLATLLVAVVGASCSADPALGARGTEPAAPRSAAPATSADAGATRDVTYADIEAFHDVVVEAGLDCSRWRALDTTDVIFVAESGTCGKATRLWLFDSPSDKAGQVRAVRQVNAGPWPSGAFLVGPNWIVSGVKPVSALKALRDVIGGRLDY